MEATDLAESYANNFRSSPESTRPISSSSFARLLEDDVASVLARIMNCKKLGTPPGVFVSHVQVTKSEVVIWSCEPLPYAAPIAKFPRLAAMTAKARNDFEIEDSGVHWAGGFALDLEGVKSTKGRAINPSAASRRAWEAFGRNVQAMRKDAGLRQVDVEGLSEREVRRIEKGEVTLSQKSQDELAEALGFKPVAFAVAAWSPSG